MIIAVLNDHDDHMRRMPIIPL